MLNETNATKALKIATNTARCVLGAHHPAVEDIAQDAMIKVMSAAYEASSLDKIVSMTAANAARDYLRRARNKNHDSADTIGATGDDDKPMGVILEGPDGRATAERSRETARLYAAIAELDATDRVFAMALIDGRSLREAGDLAGFARNADGNAVAAQRAKRRIFATLRDRLA